MLIDYLRNAYLFQDLSLAELELVAGYARERIVEPEEFVYHKGDEGTDFFVIGEGKVQLIVETHGDFSCVAEQVSSGGHFGEVALLTGKPRSLHVKSLARTRLLLFDAQAFRTVLLANSLIHARLDKALAERLSLASRERSDSGTLYSARGSATALHSTGDRPERRTGFPRSAEGPGPDEFRVDLELARKIRDKIQFFAGLDSPVLICGEPGTGRRLAAKQIHLQSARQSQPYIELDMRQFTSWIWERKLFGHKQDSFPFSSGRQLGILEQVPHGTLVLCHAETMSWELQQMLFHAYHRKKFSSIDSDTEQECATRFFLSCPGGPVFRSAASREKSWHRIVLVYRLAAADYFVLFSAPFLVQYLRPVGPRQSAAESTSPRPPSSGRSHHSFGMDNGNSLSCGLLGGDCVQCL